MISSKQVVKACKDGVGITQSNRLMMKINKYEGLKLSTRKLVIIS